MFISVQAPIIEEDISSEREHIEGNPVVHTVCKIIILTLNKFHKIRKSL